MSLSCRRCDNQVDGLDVERSTIIESFDGTWCVDLIVKCPHCGLLYNTFVPTSELQPLNGDDNEQ